MRYLACLLAPALMLGGCSVLVPRTTPPPDAAGSWSTAGQGTVPSAVPDTGATNMGSSAGAGGNFATGAPTVVQGESLGLLSFVSEGVTSESARHGRRNLALALGEAVKLSLYNLRLQARLREQANRDPLTGLFNRRYLEDSLARELHRAHRLREPIGLAMLQGVTQTFN